MNVHVFYHFITKIGKTHAINFFWGEDLWNDGETNCGASYQIRHSPGQGVVWKPGHYFKCNKICITFLNEYQVSMGSLRLSCLPGSEQSFGWQPPPWPAPPPLPSFHTGSEKKYFSDNKEKHCFTFIFVVRFKKFRFFYNLIPKLHAIWLTKYFLAIKLKIM